MSLLFFINFCLDFGGALQHLKTDNRLSRNFLRGIVGDQINVMLAAAAFNFKKWMRNAETFFVSF
jgi:IS5 family transposase